MNPLTKALTEVYQELPPQKQAEMLDIIEKTIEQIEKDWNKYK